MAASRRLTESLAAAGALLVGRRCLVALSGGPDSAVLAWLAVEFGEEARAVHVHHGWPGSDEMATAAGAVAAAVGIGLEVVAVQPGDGASPEGQAREARYRALQEAMRPGETLLVGHTRNDQAETVLFNVARGAGPRGVAGIPPRRGSLLRPLLDVDRADIELLAKDLTLPAIADPSNHDPALTRSRVRSALPVVESAVGGRVVAGLVRSGRIAAEDDDVLDRMTRAIPTVRRGDTLQIPRAVLSGLPAALQRRVVLGVLRELRPYGGSAAELDRVISLLDRGEGVTELSGGFLAATSTTMLVLGPVPASAPDPVAWSLDGTVLPWGSWLLSAVLSDQRPALVRGSRAVVFDASGFGADSLTVRPVRADDRIAISGGHKSVRDVIGEGGVPIPGRSSYPVVLAGTTVLWVPGLRRASLGWVSEATSRYLCLRIVEEGAWKSERC